MLRTSRCLELGKYKMKRCWRKTVGRKTQKVKIDNVNGSTASVNKISKIDRIHESTDFAECAKIDRDDGAPLFPLAGRGSHAAEASHSRMRYAMPAIPATSRHR